MKKITMIISTALLLTAVSGYATPTINEMVETKVNQAEVMLAPAPGPIKPAGAVIKLVIEVFQKSAKTGDEMVLKKFIKLTKLTNANTNLRSLSTFNKEIYLHQALGHALYEEMSILGLTISKHFQASRNGYRRKGLFGKLGNNIVETSENVESLHFLTKGDVEYRKALAKIKENPTIKLDELAEQVKKEILAESREKLKLKTGSKKPIRTSPIKDESNLTSVEKKEGTIVVTSFFDEKLELVKEIRVSANIKEVTEFENGKIIREQEIFFGENNSKIVIKTEKGTREMTASYKDGSELVEIRKKDKLVKKIGKYEHGTLVYERSWDGKIKDTFTFKNDFLTEITDTNKPGVKVKVSSDGKSTEEYVHGKLARSIGYIKGVPVISKTYDNEGKLVEEIVFSGDPRKMITINTTEGKYGNKTINMPEAEFYISKYNETEEVVEQIHIYRDHNGIRCDRTIDGNLERTTYGAYGGKYIEKNMQASGKEKENKRVVFEAISDFEDINIITR